MVSLMSQIKPALPAPNVRVGNFFSLKDKEGNISVIVAMQSVPTTHLCCFRVQEPEQRPMQMGVAALENQAAHGSDHGAGQLHALGRWLYRITCCCECYTLPIATVAIMVVPEVMVITVVPNDVSHTNGCHSLTAHFGAGSGGRASCMSCKLLHNLR